MEQNLKVFVSEASPKGVAAVYCNLANYANTTTIDVASEFYVASNQPVRVTGGAGQVFYEWYDPWAKPRKFEGYVGTVNVYGSGVIAVWKCVRLENGTAGGVPPSMPFYTDPGAVPEVTEVEVTNFPDPQNIAGNVQIDNFPVTQDVNVTNVSVNVNGNVGVSGSVDASTYGWDASVSTTATAIGSSLPASIALPGYNTVPPTVEVGQMTVDTVGGGPFRAAPVVLMMYDATNNKWRAAACNASGELLVD